MDPVALWTGGLPPVQSDLSQMLPPSL